MSEKISYQVKSYVDPGIEMKYPPNQGSTDKFKRSTNTNLADSSRIDKSQNNNIKINIATDELDVDKKQPQKLHIKKDEEVENSLPNKLILTIIDSKFNKVGEKLIITPKGLTGSERMERNQGVVYFGLRTFEYQNDFFFNDEEGISKRHFEIRFDKSTNNYRAKNYNESGLFIKIDKYQY